MLTFLAFYAPPWWVASLVANLAIATIEATYRAGKFSSFWAASPYLFVPILVAQWALYHSFRGAPTMLAAWALFSAVNAIVRVLNAHCIVGEPTQPLALIGIGIIVLGSAVVQLAK